jgi:D-sedoheptulose 7-phosphate isomerase
MFNEYVSQNVKILENISASDLSSFTSLFERLRLSDSTLWVIGNGGSASTASHFVADFNKTILTGGKALRTFALSELVSLGTAYSNDVSFEDSYQLTLSNIARSGDAVLILSVSGTSPNLVAAFETAKKKGLVTACIVGKGGFNLAKACDYSILLDSKDYQLIENAHVSIMHWFVKVLGNAN